MSNYKSLHLKFLVFKVEFKINHEIDKHNLKIILNMYIKKVNKFYFYHKSYILMQHKVNPAMLYIAQHFIKTSSLATLYSKNLYVYFYMLMYKIN